MTTRTIKAYDDLNGMTWGTTARIGEVTTGGSSLLTDLVASWKLDDLNDATGRGNTLTNSGSATFNTGKIGNAAYFSTVSSQFLYIANNTDVGMGDIDWTLGCWVYLNSKTNSQRIVSKDSDAADSREWNLFYDNGADAFIWAMNDTAGTGYTQTFTGLSPSINTWYCIIAWHVATSSLDMSVNDTATAGPSGMAVAANDPSGAQFQIGARQYSGFQDYMDGRVDNVNLWKRLLTAGEKTAFYNSGTGIEYPF